MSWQDRIYSSVPIWGQQLLVAAYGWWWYYQRYNTHFYRLLDELKREKRGVTNNFDVFQNELLRKLLVEGKKSNYYKSALQSFDAAEIPNPLENLKNFPLLQ